MCHQTPLVELVPAGAAPRGCSPRSRPTRPGRSSSRSSSPRASRGGSATRLRRWLDRLLTDEAGDPVAQRAIDPATRRAGLRLPGPAAPRGHRVLRPVDPTDLDEYLRHDGFQALRHCLGAALAGGDRRARSTASGLRGRGGAGFPTGLKWADGPRRRRRRKSTSSATATKATPAPSWTACCWNRSPTASSRAWPSPPAPSGPTRASSTSAPNIRWPSSGSTRPCEQCRQRGLLGERVLGSDFRLHLSVQGGGGGVRLRRGDGAAGLARGPPRHAPAAAALSGRVRPVGQTHLGQQRRDLRPGAVDLPPRRRGLRRAGHRKEQGHQGLRPGRQGPPRRADRGAHGHHHPPDRRGDRRRRGRRPHASRPCRSAGPPAAASPPSWPTRRWITRPWPRWAPSWAPAAWSCWTTPTAWSISPATSSASPRTSRAASVRFCRVGTRRMLDILDRICTGGRAKPATWRSLNDLAATVGAGEHLRPGPHRAQPGALHAPLFPRRVRGPPGGPLPGRQVQGADRLPRHRRLHRLHALRPAVPGRRHPHDALRRSTRSTWTSAPAATPAGRFARSRPWWWNRVDIENTENRRQGVRS